MIHLVGRTFELVEEHKNGFNFEALRDRYSEVLDRYDYIVGDWGYNQLRLKGFYKENNHKAGRESSFVSVRDYLNEYCNFGCAYFILEKVPVPGDEPLPPFPEPKVTVSVEGAAADRPEGDETAAKPQAAGFPQANRWRHKDREPQATWSEPAARETSARPPEARAAGERPARDGQRGGDAVPRQGDRGPRRHERGRGKDQGRGRERNGPREHNPARESRESRDNRPPRETQEAREPRQGRDRDRRERGNRGNDGAGGGYNQGQNPKQGQPPL